jgi:hypothetical protein
MDEFDKKYHQSHTITDRQIRLGNLRLLRDVAILDGDGDEIRKLEIEIEKEQGCAMALPKRFIQKVEMHRITSEPIDGTRYDFFVYKHGDYFWFYDKDSGFNFPTYLRYSAIKDIDPENDFEQLMEIADWYNCNAHTVAECIIVIHIVNGTSVSKTKEIGR